MSYARISYDGGAGSYAVPFPYITKSHVGVYVDDALYDGTVTWTSDATIELDPDASGAQEVRIQRSTPIQNPIATFTSPTAASDLQLGDTQNRYAIQELIDGLEDGELTVGLPESTLADLALAQYRHVQLVLGAPGEALVTGDSLARWWASPQFDQKRVLAVYASVDPGGESSSGLPTFQLRRSRAGVNTDLLSTKVTIDAGEESSLTAAAVYVISPTERTLASGDSLFADCDVAGTDATGAILHLLIGP